MLARDALQSGPTGTPAAVRVAEIMRSISLKMGSVEIKTAREIDAMREVGRLAADTLSAVGEMIRPGITTEDINHFVHTDTLKKGAIPAPLNYKGFPKSVCTSINEVVCHGIPGPRV